MNIVFLDASTLHHGDLELTPLEALGSLTCHATTAPEQTIDRCRGAEVVITNKVVIDRRVLEACPGLKMIAIAATGVNCVDLDAARERGVVVCNVSGYSTESVAQHTIGMLISLASHLHTYNQEVRESWPRSPIFTRLDHPVVELAGRTLGIVGYGEIGRAVGRIAGAMGMRIIALAREARQDDDIERLPHGQFFREADAVSLHCPLTPQTTGLIDGEVLTLMKQSAYLVNTGRGPLVNEPDLAAALRSGDIAGAALDVLSVEPPDPDHPLLAADIPNLLITPHTAWSTLQARRRLLQGLVVNIRAFLEQRPVNRVA